MNVWRDELVKFSDAIRGAELSPHGMVGGLHYPLTIALDIYGNNYHGNLQDALAAAFPLVEQIVGADFFRVLARKFIEQHPSRSGNLHEYGAEMPDFIATFPPAQSLTYLADVAMLDWACHRAYYATDAAPFDVARLQMIPAEHYAKLIWQCHPSCYLLSSPYPLLTIWQAHQPGADQDFHVDLDSGGGTVLVYRNNDVVEVRALSAAEGDWLQRIQAGATMGAAADATLADYPDFDLSATLGNFVQQGVLVDFHLE